MDCLRILFIIKKPDMQIILINTFTLSKVGGGNGNPLQYSCLECSMDTGAW